MNLIQSLSVAAALVGLTLATGCSSNSDSCGLDSSVSCAGGGEGWSCSGSGAQPEDYNSDLVCSTDGVGDYCCYSSQCGYDSSVACAEGVGYSCAAGADAPDATDPSLSCSDATASGNLDLYCCFTQ